MLLAPLADTILWANPPRQFAFGLDCLNAYLPEGMIARGWSSRYYQALRRGPGSSPNLWMRALLLR